MNGTCLRSPANCLLTADSLWIVVANSSCTWPLCQPLLQARRESPLGQALQPLPAAASPQQVRWVPVRCRRWPLHPQLCHLHLRSVPSALHISVLPD